MNRSKLIKNKAEIYKFKISHVILNVITQFKAFKLFFTF